mmetsp:Transcript_10568/g.24482  ORF Transcript_10568/g.24482 Transcript_10568/m.24482 type:complete len:588 (-) Transcript_10568:1872-3635(-)
MQHALPVQIRHARGDLLRNEPEEAGRRLGLERTPQIAASAVLKHHAVGGRCHNGAEAAHNVWMTQLLERAELCAPAYDADGACARDLDGNDRPLPGGDVSGARCASPEAPFEAKLLDGDPPLVVAKAAAVDSRHCRPFLHQPLRQPRVLDRALPLRRARRRHVRRDSQWRHRMLLPIRGFQWHAAGPTIVHDAASAAVAFCVADAPAVGAGDVKKELRLQHGRRRRANASDGLLYRFSVLARVCSQRFVQSAHQIGAARRRSSRRSHHLGGEQSFDVLQLVHVLGVQIPALLHRDGGAHQLQIEVGLELPVQLGQLRRVHLEARRDELQQRRRRALAQRLRVRPLLVHRDDQIGEGAARKRWQQLGRQRHDPRHEAAYHRGHLLESREGDQHRDGVARTLLQHDEALFVAQHQLTERRVLLQRLVEDARVLALLLHRTADCERGVHLGALQLHSHRNRSVHVDSVGLRAELCEENGHVCQLTAGREECARRAALALHKMQQRLALVEHLGHVARRCGLLGVVGASGLRGVARSRPLREAQPARAARLGRIVGGRWRRRRLERRAQTRAQVARRMDSDAHQLNGAELL